MEEDNIKTRKQILSILLSIFMVVMMLPAGMVTAWAEEDTSSTGKAIQLVKDGMAPNLEAGCNTENAATVYYGGENAWRVIGYSGEGFTCTYNVAGTMTLLSAGNRGTTQFDESENSNVYGSSTLKGKIETIADEFSLQEKAVVIKRDLINGSYDEANTDCVAGTEPVKGAFLWPLSPKEAESVNRNLRIADPEHMDWESSCWWLRSPGQSDKSTSYVYITGFVNKGGNYIGAELGVRPAFNLNLNSVLFTSAAEGGKSSQTEGLSEINNYDGTDWKLTLLDSSRKFSVTEKSVTVNPGGTVHLNYTNATVNNDTAPNKYISAILADENDNLLYYGRLSQPDKADGEVSIKLPDELEYGEYTLKLFSEQYNGDYKTDYASDFSDVELTINTSVKDCPRDDTCPIAPFTDTDKNAWYHDGVHWALQKAIMYGTDKTTFEPMTPTTRAMLVTMLWRMEGAPVVDYRMSFTDVYKGQWYTEAIRWAASTGIVNGYNEETFGTNNNVTREQLATILYRSAQAKGKGFQGGWAFLLDFDDADQVSDWADEAMHCMVMKGVINGVSERELSPGTDAVRAQVATMLMRFNENAS